MSRVDNRATGQRRMSSSAKLTVFRWLAWRSPLCCLAMSPSWSPLSRRWVEDRQSRLQLGGSISPSSSRLMRSYPAGLNGSMLHSASSASRLKPPSEDLLARSTLRPKSVIEAGLPIA